MDNGTRHFVRKLKFTAISILAALVLAPACSLVHKRVETEKLLTPLASASTSDLISAVNKLVSVKSIHGRVDIQFEDTSFATSGLSEKYRTVDGSIYLQRPSKEFLAIQGPLAIDIIAAHPSEGENVPVLFAEVSLDFWWTMIGLAALPILIGLNGFFVAAEYGLVTARRNGAATRRQST